MCPPPDREEEKDLTIQDALSQLWKMFFGLWEYIVWAVKTELAEVARQPAKPMAFYF